MKTGPEYVLNHMGVYQLFRDGSFVKRAPAFFHLNDIAKHVVKHVGDSLVKPRCDNCGTLREMIKPLAISFKRTIIKLKEEHPDALQPLLDVIAERLGYRPDRIILYYEQDGKLASMEL